MIGGLHVGGSGWVVTVTQGGQIRWSLRLVAVGDASFVVEVIGCQSPSPLPQGTDDSWHRRHPHQLQQRICAMGSSRSFSLADLVATSTGARR
jgi:hypothetical protein